LYYIADNVIYSAVHAELVREGVLRMT